MPAQSDNAPSYTDRPIGIDAHGTRTEFDSLGTVEVPADRYWGAQTQRSLQHFSIGNDHMPIEVYRAYGLIKKACALVNEHAGRLEPWRARVIIQAAEEAIAGKLDDQFPLFVWQTGSGTQSNMNVNEVTVQPRHPAARRRARQPESRSRPNDHVNMGQSRNDTFPTAMHIAAVTEIDDRLLPSVKALHDDIAAKAAQWMDVVKIGRTHLEDAVPLTRRAGMVGLGRATSRHARMNSGTPGTACWSWPLAAPRWAPASTPAPGSVASVAGARPNSPACPTSPRPTSSPRWGRWTPMVRAHAALRGAGRRADEDRQRHALACLRTALRAGELVLPANEPGSSIMPGKVNPTQCEALVMICHPGDRQ